MKKIIILTVCLISFIMIFAQRKGEKTDNRPRAHVDIVNRIEPVTKIAFEAIINTPQPSPRSPLRFDAVRYNDGEGFSTHDNSFTAPTAGLYFFSINLSWNGYGCGFVGGSVSVTALKNGRESLQTLNNLAPHSSTGGFSTVLTFSTKLNARDKISIAVVNILCTSGGGTTALLHNGKFSGYRVYAD